MPSICAVFRFRCLFWCAVACISLYAESGVAESSIKCEKLWSKIVEKKSEYSFEGRVNRWEKLAYEACNESGYYHFGLAELLLEEGYFDRALNVVQLGLNKSGASAQKLRATRIRILIKKGGDLEQSGSAEEAKNVFLKAQESLEVLKSDYPRWDWARLQLSFVSLLLRDYRNVIHHSKAALEFSDHYAAYRNMAVAYYWLGEFRDSIKSAEKAFNRNRDVFKDVGMMLAVARSYYELGQFKLAHASLVKLAQERPSVRQDELFKEVARKVNAARSRSHSE